MTLDLSTIAGVAYVGIVCTMAILFALGYIAGLSTGRF